MDHSETFQPYNYIRNRFVNPDPPVPQREADMARVLELIPGPPPPESWTLVDSRGGTNEMGRRERQRRAQDGPRGGVELLVDIAARVVARNVESFYAQRQSDDLYDFATIPFRTKQMILRYAPSERPISDKILPMFVDDGYVDLCFECATISFVKFVRTFWKVMRRRPHHIAESWEDLTEIENNSNDDENDEAAAVNDMGLLALSSGQPIDEEDEMVNAFPPYLISIFSLPSTATMLTHIISSPLASTLHHLNISFTTFPAIPFAHLLIITLPRLTSLGLAGCFTRYDGPHALSLLSRGLSLLEKIDLGHCEWVSAEVLCGHNAFVNWERDWRALKELRLESCCGSEGSALVQEVGQWLDSVRVGRCKVIVVGD